MNRRFLMILAISLLPQLASAALTVHEWGTFTSLVGSNGRTQNGMHHEDEHLPDFIYNFGETQQSRSQTEGHLFPPGEFPNSPANPPVPRPQRPPPCGKGCLPNEFIERNIISQKMETPVIYFYSPTPQLVKVDVKFPEGVISQTFPGPTYSMPNRHSRPILANGHTVFDVAVLSPQDSVRNAHRVPAVPHGNIYAHARNVRSNLIMAGNEKEFERFIFYRGLGRFQPKIAIRSEVGGLFLGGENSQAGAPIAFLVDVDQRGNAVLLPLGAIPAGGVRPVIVDAKTMSSFRRHTPVRGAVAGMAAYNAIVNGLVQQGLFRDEALAMVNTWYQGYLRTPGLRLLYILPRQEVDEILPLKLTPRPASLARVFVGRIEIFTDLDELNTLERILAERDRFQVRSLGRFAEPMLRRVLEVYRAQQVPLRADPQVERLILRLIHIASRAQ